MNGCGGYFIPYLKSMGFHSRRTVIDGEVLIDLRPERYPDGVSHVGGYTGSVLLEDPDCIRGGEYPGRDRYGLRAELAGASGGAVREYVEDIAASLQYKLDRAKSRTLLRAPALL